ncbi:SufE family protein [Escherichia coli]|nr:SufE family protein [Escherichia coli]
MPDAKNRVWLGYTVAENGKMHFFGDSEGRIVRGLLAVLLTAVEGEKPPPSCRHSHHWHCLMSWDYVRSLAPHAARGLNALSEAIIAATKQV